MECPPHKPEHDGTAGPLANERRTAARYACNLESTCQPLTGAAAQSWPARVVDISAGGIAFVLERRFERGALLSMRLESPDGDLARNLLLRVAYAKADVDGSWRHGCAFASELGDDELRAFKAERVRPTEPEVRAWVRFTCDVKTVCRAVAPARDQTWPVRVLDASPGGLSLLSPRQCERGVILGVEAPGTAMPRARPVLVRVVHDRPCSANEWILGCELAEQISAQELQCFQ
jgi:hypothetical protein